MRILTLFQIVAIVQLTALAHRACAQSALPTQIANPLNSTSPIDTGYREMYNLDFSGAHVAFQQWERSHPEDPLGPTSEAAADLFWEFNQMHVLESDLFMDDDKFFYRRAAPDPQVKLRFEQEVARAENLASAARAHTARWQRSANKSFRRRHGGRLRRANRESLFRVAGGDETVGPPGPDAAHLQSLLL